ncbi:MAG: efflux RND transporter periplasmic adaptor subunit [Verrucomicrobiia bacterium]|jgi:HlyD family secretion protein
MANNKKSRKTKWIVLAIAVVAVLAAGAWYVKSRRSEDPGYQTAMVTRGDLIQYVTATGQLNPVTNVQVGSQISGIVSHLYADWNSQVTNGQLVALIDPATYQANVLQVQSDLANSRAALELAQVNERRSKELLDSKLIPQSDYDTAIANLHQAEATVLNKQAALTNAQVNLDRCTISSPVDGVVISRSVDVGQTVAASLSAPTLFVIANDLTKMQIDANVAEADIGGVAVGQKVDFSVDAYPNRRFHGEVVQVRYNPVTVQNVVTYDTVIGVSNPDLKLMPGMTANVFIIIAERDNALKIPNAALRFRPPDVLAASKTNAAAAQVAAAGQRGGGVGGPAGGGGGGRGGGGRNRPDRSLTRTIYTLPAGTDAAAKSAKPAPVQIKVGINDGISTEVVDVLKEGDVVVTGVAMTETAQAAQPTNPFGGGFRRF